MRGGKNFVAVFMAAVMLFSMAGCGEKDVKKEKMNEGTDKDTKEMVFRGTYLLLEGMVGEISTFVVQNDTLYINTKERKKEGTGENSTAKEESKEDDKSAEKTIHRIYTANLDGSDVKEIPLPEFGENQSMSNLLVGDDGNLTVLLQETAVGQGKKACFIMQVDAEGKELLKEDVTKTLKLTQEDTIIKILWDNNKHLMIATDRSVYVVDEDYKLFCKVKCDSSSLAGVAKTKEGNIVCSTRGAEGTKVQVLDVDQKKWGESINLGLDSMIPLIDGMEYDFYYKDDSGIYGYDMAEEKNTKIIDYVASNLSAESTDAMVPIGEHQLLGIEQEKEEKSRLVLYKKMDPTTVSDKTIITYGGDIIPTPVQKAAIAFNKQSKKYKVEFKDYANEEESLTKLNMDIIAGNAPDIIALDNLSIEQYVVKGVLEDLTPYYKKDTDIKIENLIPSVAEAMQIDGKYYYVAPIFNVFSLAGSSKDVGTEKGWTFEEMRTVLQEKGDGVRPFFSENKLNLLHGFNKTGFSEFVDWETGTCSFDSQDFKDMLEFCNTGKNTAEDFQSPDPDTAIKEGKVLFMEGGVGIMNMPSYTDLFHNEGFTFIGYPNEEKQGNYFTFTMQAGIYAKSEVKEGAWEFLRILMTKEYQGMNDNTVPYGNPTRQDCFDMQVKAKTTTVPYTDEMGQEITPVKSQEGYVFDPTLKPLTQEEADQYIDLVNSTKRSGGYNPFIMSMIEEEALIYFAGDRDLEKTVDIIQDRMTTYVNENR